IERELGADEEVAALIIAEKGFLPLANPFDRTADAPRGPGDESEFRIEGVAGAEIAADVAGDHAHALGRHAEHVGELMLLAHHAAAAGVERVAAARRIIMADGGARLHRYAGDALHPGFETDGMCRVRERRGGRGGIADLRIDADVRARLVPQPR